MHHAFTVLHLSPTSFWAMTPREFAATLPPQRASAPMLHARLLALMAEYPDTGQ